LLHELWAASWKLGDELRVDGREEERDLVFGDDLSIDFGCDSVDLDGLGRGDVAENQQADDWGEEMFDHGMMGKIDSYRTDSWR
jgi:hypothetical protein